VGKFIISNCFKNVELKLGGWDLLEKIMNKHYCTYNCDCGTVVFVKNRHDSREE